MIKYMPRDSGAFRMPIETMLNTVDEENIDAAISGGCLFGWGNNTYDASSDVITLKFMFTGPEIPYASLPLEGWMISSTHTHEVGHYILASSTRLGITLRRLSALLDGLIPMIAEEMQERTGKVWVPFNTLPQTESHPHLRRLLKAVHMLDLLRSQLIEGWRITNELFALCLSALYGYLIKHYLDYYGWGKDEYLWATSIISDTALVEQVSKRISAALGRSLLFETEIPSPADWEEVFATADAIFYGTDKREALEVLEALQYLLSGVLRDKANEKSREGPGEAFLRSIAETAAAFSRGKDEHKAAKAIFERFGQGGDEFFKMMGLIGVISDFYAPVLLPEKLFESDSHVERLPRIDKALGPILARYMHKSLEDITSDFSQASHEICYVQEMLGSVTLKDLEGLNPEHVLGTHEWFESVLCQLHLDRRRRKILRAFLAGSQIESEGIVRIVSSQGKKAFPWGLGSTLQVFLACRRWAAGRFPKLAGVYDALDSFGLTCSRAMKNAVSLYHSFVAFMAVIDHTRWCLPSVTICYEGKNVLLALGADETSLQVKHSILRALLDELRQSLFGRGRSNVNPVVFCPLGVLEDKAGLCSCDIKSCIIRRLAHVFTEGSIFLCSGTEPARLLRLERHPDEFGEVGRIGLKVLKRPAEDMSDHPENVGAGNRNARKPPSIDWRKPLSTSAHPSAVIIGQFLGMALYKAMLGAISIVGAPIELMSKMWRYSLCRRQRKIDANMSKSVRKMWELLKKLALASEDQRS